MQVADILSKHLSKVIHKTRLNSLSIMVGSLFHTKFFSLTGLGRALRTEAQERSSIRRVDRFLGNIRLQEDRLKIYSIFCKLIVGNAKKVLIIIDWSTIPNQNNYLLRASLVADGRALTLYEEVHPEKKYTHPRVHLRFLNKLKSMLSEDIIPIIITDAGFGVPWFKAVCKLGWDYVGRIRGNKLYRQLDNLTWIPILNLHSKATNTPIFFGKIELTRDSKFETNLFLYKSKKAGRKNKTKRGNLKQNGQSKKHAKGNKEPWVLVSSLTKNSNAAKKVIKIYSFRMQIEEGFRDLKSTKYGFGFEHVNTKRIYRLNIFFLIAMLASLFAWLIGWQAEKFNLHFKYQSNSIKNRRVLSLFFLGTRIILHDQHLTQCLIDSLAEQNYMTLKAE